MVRRVMLFGACAVLLLLPVRLSAQSPTANLTGVVQSSDGTPLEGVTVVSRNVETGYQYRTLTTANGRYFVPGLPPGQYEVTAQRMDFAPSTKQDVRLAIGRTLQVSFTLTAVPLEMQELEVVAKPPLIETTESDVSYVLDRRTIETVPQETRRILDLVRWAPGANAGINVDYLGLPVGAAAVGVLNSHSLGVLVDGGDYTLGTTNDISGNIPLLAVEEFEVVTTRYAPEFARAASGVVNVATRRGSNTWAAEGFGLYRHNTLNARGVFEQTKPDYNRTHWGAAWGGPLVRDQTHMFAALERRTENVFATVQTQGVFPDREGTFRTPLEENLLFARLDHRPTDDHELTLRYVGHIYSGLGEVGVPGVCGISGRGGISTREFGADITRNTHSALLRHRWRMGGTTINEARLHAIRFETGRKRFGFDPALEYSTACLGSNPYEWDANDNRIEFRDDLSTVFAGGTGTHRVKFGAHLGWLRFGFTNDWFSNGWFVFESDTASMASVGFIGLGPQSVSSSNFQIGLYAQDDWNPGPQLTLSLGLRYDIETSATNQGFINPYEDVFSFLGSGSRPIDANNIAPRIGFAWDPRGDDRTVIRGGFGIFYDQYMTQFKWHETKDRLATFVPGPVFPDPDSVMVDAGSAPPSPSFFSRDMEAPMTSQFSLGVEHATVGNVVLRLDGVYAKGRNLLITRTLNTEDSTGAIRYPEFGFVDQYLSKGEAEGAMLVAQVSKTFSQGRLGLSYTLANRKTTHDKWWGEFTPQVDPENDDFSGELGPAAWDERHRVVGTGEARFPFGLNASVVAIYSSGRPYSIVTGTDDNGDFFLNDRPLGIGRNSARASGFFSVDVGLKQWFSAGQGRVALVANVYNLTNDTNFDSRSVVGNLRSSAFGRPLAAFPKRQVEIGLEARF